MRRGRCFMGGFVDARAYVAKIILGKIGIGPIRKDLENTLGLRLCENNSR